MATHRVPLQLAGFETDGNAFVAAIDLDPLVVQTVCHKNATADSTSFWMARVPENYVGSARVLVSAIANATSGAWRATLGSAAPADGESLDVSFTDETAIDTTVPATAYLRDEVTFPASGDLATTLAAGDLLVVRLVRNGNHANDTLAVDLHVVGVWLSYADV